MGKEGFLLQGQEKVWQQVFISFHVPFRLIQNIQNLIFSSVLFTPRLFFILYHSFSFTMSHFLVNEFLIQRESFVACMPVDYFCSDQSGSFSGVEKLPGLGSWEESDLFRRTTKLNPSNKSESREPWSPHLDLNSHINSEVLGPMGQSMPEMKHQYLPPLTPTRRLS